MTERMAANWMTTSNISLKGDASTPISGFTNFKCAVEDMGRNSVRPSTMARMMVWMIFIEAAVNR
jgi:hypothetical protein